MSVFDQTYMMIRNTIDDHIQTEKGKNIFSKKYGPAQTKDL